MGIFNDIPPTAGLPVSAGDLVWALRNRSAGGLLARDFRHALGAPFTVITCSGTTALYIICESLKALSEKRTILVPSFICPLVALAIRRAGFYIMLYDLEPESFDGDAGQVAAACAANPDIAAILVNHLGGIPADLARFGKTIRDFGLFVIEDCAQSFGAVSRGKPVGTLGDFSFFSLAAGKGLTMYEGGVLVANRAEYGEVLRRKVDELVLPDRLFEARRILELLGLWAFYRPFLFWFVFSLPQLFWSRRGDDIKALREDFDLDFPVHAVSAFRKAAGHRAFPRVEEAIGIQRAKAAYYIDGLADVRGLRVVQESESDVATYPYLTVLFSRPEQRIRALRAFSGAGLGASQIYARALPDYGYLRGIVPNSNCENARRLAARAITLSTSAFIKKSHIEKCLEILRHAARS